MPVNKSHSGLHIDPALTLGDSPFRDSLLVAMPGLHNDIFARSVIYICAHSNAGAMGIVLNQPMPGVDFSELLTELNVPRSISIPEPLIHFGGPVETSRGFILHSSDFTHSDTVRLNDRICITGTVDILRDISAGKGPRKSLFALGYAGWEAGQLEAEIQDNAWLTVPADDEVIFSTNLPQKWEKALSRLGIDPLSLSSETGHA
jgi:putative transcriptional regulator